MSRNHERSQLFNRRLKRWKIKSGRRWANTRKSLLLVAGRKASSAWAGDLGGLLCHVDIERAKHAGPGLALCWNRRAIC